MTAIQVDSANIQYDPMWQAYWQMSRQLNMQNAKFVQNNPDSIFANANMSPYMYSNLNNTQNVMPEASNDSTSVIANSSNSLASKGAPVVEKSGDGKAIALTTASIVLPTLAYVLSKGKSGTKLLSKTRFLTGCKQIKDDLVSKFKGMKTNSAIFDTEKDVLIVPGKKNKIKKDNFDQLEDLGISKEAPSINEKALPEGVRIQSGKFKIGDTEYTFTDGKLDMDHISDSALKNKISRSINQLGRGELPHGLSSLTATKYTHTEGATIRRFDDKGLIEVETDMFRVGSVPYNQLPIEITGKFNDDTMKNLKNVKEAIYSPDGKDYSLKIEDGKLSKIIKDDVEYELNATGVQDIVTGNEYKGILEKLGDLVSDFKNVKFAV